MSNFDLVVIGGGPGGYVAAIKASQLGLQTALVEKEALGGVCLNWGCIPTKALLRNAAVIQTLTEGETFGFSFDNLSVDYSAAHRRSREVVGRLTQGVGYLMRKHNITVYNGTARLKNTTPSATQIDITPGGETVTAQNVILATGASPRQIPGVQPDGNKIITYREALDLTDVPASIAIIGAGPIGMEFATIWNRYGATVTVIEMMPHVLPLEDETISQEAEKLFRQTGLDIKTGARVETMQPTAAGVEIALSGVEGAETIIAEKVLVAIGFAPNSQNLGLEAVGVTTTQGHIDIDDRMQTSVSNIYAIGDVTGKLGLAHVASAQGIIAAEVIAGRNVHPLDYAKIPRCTYAAPEVASVGLTEKEARQQGYDVVTAQFPFQVNGMALAAHTPDGFVKIVSEAKYQEVLGVHLLGDHVTELIAGPAGLLTLESTVEELVHTVHPHPSLSEAIMEAAHMLAGGAIHV